MNMKRKMLLLLEVVELNRKAMSLLVDVIIRNLPRLDHEDIVVFTYAKSLIDEAHRLIRLCSSI